MEEASKSLDGAARSLFESTAVAKPTAQRGSRTERSERPTNSNALPATKSPQLPVQGQRLGSQSHMM